MNENLQQEDVPNKLRQRTHRFVWVFRFVLYGLLALAFFIGGPVLRIADGAAAIFAFFGDLDGGLRHTLRIVGLGLAIWLAPGLGAPLGEWLVSQFAVPLLLSRAIGILGAGIGVLVAVSLIGRLARGFTRRRRGLNSFDRVFGCVVGGAEGALLIATVCWTLAVFEEPLRLMRYQLARSDQSPPSSIVWLVEQLDEFSTVVQRDPTGRMVLDVNPLADVPMVQTVKQVAEVVAEPETLTALMQSRELKEIAELPAVKRHLDAISNDPELKLALENRDIAKVMSSPQWSAMLNDAELFDTIMSRAAAIRGALRNVSAARAQQLAKSGGPGAKQQGRQVAQPAKSTLRTP